METNKTPEALAPEAIARAFLAHLNVELEENEGKPVVGKWEHPSLKQPFWFRFELYGHQVRTWLTQARLQLFSAERNVRWWACVGDRQITLAIESRDGSFHAAFFPEVQAWGLVAVDPDLVMAYSVLLAAWSEFSRKIGLDQLKQKEKFEI